ncbi:MAG: hypothetical protein OFPII_17100 [Osedax symbiont Rs1]|nr:MAG: hypothetical protein OFPII_17100 [Osedax symbiont Rs1]
MIYFAIGSGCLVIVGLIIYILSSFKTARLKKEQQQQVIEEHLKEHNERQEYVTSSINIITKALGTEQIEVVEASIRLKMLTDQLRPNLAENSLPNIEQVFAKTQHIPKLKDWKSLEKKQRKLYSKEINVVENQYRDAVKEEVKVLMTMMEQR